MAAYEAMPDLCVSVSGDSVTLEGPCTANSADRALYAAICGAPRWSSDSTASASESAARLLRRYESRGADVLEELSGVFALCIVDRARNRILAAADRLGVQRIHFESGPNGVRISNSLAALVKSRGHAPALDPQAVYDYVYFHMIPAPRTIYAGIRTLRRAELLTIEHSSATTRRYWRPDWSPEVVEGAAAYEQTRALLRRAVERTLPADPSGTACFLSGGLDSSSVAGTAAGVVAPRALPAFSIGFDEAAYDESEYARAAAERFGLDWHRHELTADELLESLPAVVAATDQPFGNSSALAVYHCARVARAHGCHRMLAGDGGDEIFGGNSRYEKQLLFERFARLPAGLRRGVIAPVASALSALPGLGAARKVDSFVRQANIALPDRLQSYNYLHRHPPREVFTPRLLAQLDTAEPLDLLRAEYEATGDPHPVNRMLHLDWQFTLQDNDLVKVNSMCRHAGIEVAYPMLDDDLVQFSCHVSAADKVRRGDLRRFYRRAMRGFLPDAVIDKKKHGFGLPFGVWTRSHAGLHGLASTSIEALKARGIFEPAFLDRVLTLHRDVHAAYYGELVWILMVLELWFQHRLPDASGT